MCSSLAVICFTVLPGANRLVIFTLLSLYSTTDYFASFSTNYSFATVVSMLGGVGLGTLVIKNEWNLSLSRSLEFVFIALFLSLPLIIIGLFYFLTDKSSIAVILFSFSLVYHQCIRHELIVSKRFYRGACIELIIFIFSVLIVLFDFCLDKIYILSLLYLFVCSASKLIFNGVESDGSLSKTQLSMIGYSNLISTGVLFLLPILSSEISSPEVTKIMMLIVTSAGIVTVFPRSIFNVNINKFKKSFEEKDLDKFERLIMSFRIKVTLIMFCSFISVAVYVFYITDGFDIYSLLILSVPIFSFLFVGQLMIPEATLINIFGRERFSLVINVVSFSFFILSFIFIEYLSGNDGVVNAALLCSSVFIIYLLRVIVISRIIRQEFN